MTHIRENSPRVDDDPLAHQKVCRCLSLLHAFLVGGDSDNGGAGSSRSGAGGGGGSGGSGGGKGGHQRGSPTTLRFIVDKEAFQIVALTTEKLATVRRKLATRLRVEPEQVRLRACVCVHVCVRMRPNVGPCHLVDTTLPLLFSSPPPFFSVPVV